MNLNIESREVEKRGASQGSSRGPGALRGVQKLEYLLKGYSLPYTMGASNLS